MARDLSRLSTEALEAEIAALKAEAEHRRLTEALGKHLGTLASQVRELIAACGQDVPSFRVEYRSDGSDPLQEIKDVIVQTIGAYAEANGLEMPDLEVVYTVKAGEGPCLAVKPHVQEARARGSASTYGRAVQSAQGKPGPIRPVTWVGPEGGSPEFPIMVGDQSIQSGQTFGSMAALAKAIGLDCFQAHDPDSGWPIRLTSAETNGGGKPKAAAERLSDLLKSDKGGPLYAFIRSHIRFS